MNTKKFSMKRYSIPIYGLFYMIIGSFRYKDFTDDIKLHPVIIGVIMMGHIYSLALLLGITISIIR